MEERCEECGFDGSQAGPGEVVQELQAVRKAIERRLTAAPEDAVRRRPVPATWSPLEYVGHLCDAMGYHRWLVERALAEPAPVIPPVSPDEAVASAGYGQAEVADLLGRFGRRIERLSVAVAALGPADLGRTLHVEGREVTVALVSRSAWHECFHHSGDIERGLAR